MAYNPPSRRSGSIEILPKTVILSKEDVSEAALTCSTEIDMKKIVFGYTAKNTFHRSNSITINKLQFFHDQNKIEIMVNVRCNQEMKMEVKYSSICKLDLELSKITNSIIQAIIVINIRHPPLFGIDKKQGNWTTYVRVNPLEEGTDSGYWKSIVQSTAFRLMFNLETTEMYSFVNQLYVNVPCGVTFDPFKVAANGPICLNDLDEFIREWNWNIKYDIECIKNCGTKGSYFLNFVLFEGNIIRELSERNARKLFGAMYDHLQADPALTSLEFNERGKITTADLDENYVLVKTVYVTPTRTISTKEDLTMDSRGLRYIGVDDVIQIKFRDDNFSWFPHDLAFDIVTPTCRNGIVVADRLFFEFGGSNSLFRECGTYFCAAKNKNEVLEKYKKLGEFEPATAAKMSARMGQYFTSALNMRLQLRQSNVFLVHDIESTTVDSAGKPFCFTDGNGIISYLFAMQISIRLGLSYVPSAFQIRYAGYKGMLTVAPKDSKNRGGPYYRLLIDNDGPYFVLFRKSQKKFHVVGNDLLDFDIVQWSAPAPFNLYRTFISVLDYLAYKDGKQEVVRERLRELNNAACYDIIKPLLDNQAFMDKLEDLPSYCPTSKMETKNLMNEPFWRSMVEASVVEDAKQLANKMQLPLPANLGRTAFGNADYTGKLKENQVFFQCSKNLSTKNFNNHKPIVGRVGVTRSPIVHPGDIRFYEAVDIPELRHIFDVLVFPTVGKRPHPDEIGGGDLDGDPYAIFWDKDLILDRNFTATDFADLDADKAKKITVDKLQDEHAKFRSDYLKNRNIEHLSNCYLALSLTQDLDSRECRSMRETSDKAVNYPKSGICGRAISNDERQHFWPAFMCKEHEPAYQTSHILCELHEKDSTLYQMIKNVAEEAKEQLNENASTNENINQSNYWQKYFDDYKRQIQTIMTKHQIKTEGELFSNAFTGTLGALGKQKLPLLNDSSDTSLIQHQIHKIFKEFRSNLLDQFSENWKDDMEKQKKNVFSFKFPNISPWMIQLAKHFYVYAAEDKTCYSFPWLIWEGLDAWWSNDQEKCKIISAEEKLQKDFHEVRGKTIVKTRIITNMETNVRCKRQITVERTPSETYIEMVETWAKCKKINEEFAASEAKLYLQKLLIEKQADHENQILTGGKVFMLFLISQMQNKNANENDEEQLQKAAQDTLIKLAFLPPMNIFKRNLFQQQLMEQQCIVISVPKNWCDEFQEKHKILADLSGCQDVAIGIRRTFADSIKFSVMFRGSLDCCKKLKDMLTPFIKVQLSHSMRDIKIHIASEMNKVLKEIFNFQQPLIHSRSAPNDVARSSRSSRCQRNNNNIQSARTFPGNLNN